MTEILIPLSKFWNYKLFTIAGIKLGVGNLTLALILLIFAGRLARLVSGIIEQRVIKPFINDKSSQNTYKTFLFYGCLAGFVILSMAIAGIPLTVFTVFGGALAIGVGFGSQNIVNNFISGIILLVEKPIKVGDVVELEGITGTIQGIGTRSTQLKNAEGKIFVVPNSFFLEKSVLNWSYENPIVRTSISFGVAYGSDLRVVDNICMNILLNTEGVLQTPMPVVLFDNFGDSNLDFQLQFWCDLNQVSSLGIIRSNLRFKIDDKFKQHKIEMAFPQRDLNLRTNKPLNVKISN